MPAKKNARVFPHLPTRTARYFLSKFRTATLKGAIELAAQRERERLFTGFEECCSVPVDVEAIAQRKGLKLVELPLGSSSRDAELRPASDGFLVRLKPRVSEGRRRFTIAHEIGHSLFYDHGRHQVGLLDERESRAEEWICQKFASALLIP